MAVSKQRSWWANFAWDPNTRTAAFKDQPLTLTPVEYDLLASLARARGRVKTREQLLEEIRDRNYEVFDRSIDVHISALRKKLGDDAKEPRFIKGRCGRQATCSSIPNEKIQDSRSKIQKSSKHPVPD